MRDVLASKITKPTLDDKVIQRKKLAQKLERIRQYPVTVMTAGAGYGKTTTLVQHLASQSLPLGWYNLGPEDSSIYFFSIYLSAALDSLFPGLKDWYCDRLKQEDSLGWNILFFTFMLGIEQFDTDDKEGFLVIDDWQNVQQESDITMFFDRFLASLPARIHVIILSRQYVNLPQVENRRMKGEALDFIPTDFLFTSAEIEEFLQLVTASPLAPQEVETVLEQTEGWVMVIKLLANQWQDAAGHMAADVGNSYNSMERFFEYLSHDIFSRQTPEIQRFLMLTSLVDTFDLAYCRTIAVPDPAINAGHLLGEVVKTGLFISRIGNNVYRYHSLFKEFLRLEAASHFPNLKATYKKIGSFYHQQNSIELALHFFLLAGEWQAAVDILASVCRHWVNSGRQKLVGEYLSKLPQAYQQNPQIYLALGDQERFSSAYGKAVYWYKQAERNFKEKQDLLGWSQSCHALGEVYLDIIQPNQAQQYLRQAYKLLPPDQDEEKGSLLYLMSENAINHGQSRRAERYLRLRHAVLPFNHTDKNNLQARIYLRTGRIGQVIRLLEEKTKSEDMARTPCSFRESSLILSLCYSYTGDTEKALKYAQSSIVFADKIQSPFVAAIGHVRTGHALLLDYRHTRELCHQAYDKALAMADEMGVDRGKTEIYEGQCLMEALDGNWTEAEQIGLKAIAITEKGHDEWFAAMMYHTLGMAAGLCQQYRLGEAYSRKALGLFEKCGDYFGQATCYWQLSYQYYHLQDGPAFLEAYGKLQDYCQRYHCEFLLQGKTFLGDLTGLTPAPFQEYEHILQTGLGTPPEAAGPALQPALYVKTLGGFKLLRQGQEITAQEWHRKAAKQLLFLLLTMRTLPVEKEKLMLFLWPDAEKKVAQGNFKVVLNELTKILEPDRKPRADSKFIIKQDASLQLVMNEDCQTDVALFEQYVSSGIRLARTNQEQAKGTLLTALSLYEGEYLAGEYLDDLSLRERDRLQLLALKGGERLAAIFVEQKDYEKALAWADWILNIDNCWEKAYQLKLQCYGERHDKALLERVYRQCGTVLENELGVEPSAETRNLYKKYRI